MSASKRKGSKWERDVVEFLRVNGFPYVERRALEGINDRGDIAGIPGVVLECKATKAIDLATAMTEAEKEAKNAGVRIFAAVIKRRMKPTSEAYGVVPLWLLAELLRDAEWAPHPSVVEA